MSMVTYWYHFGLINWCFTALDSIVIIVTNNFGWNLFLLEGEFLVRKSEHPTKKITCTGALLTQIAYAIELLVKE